MHLCIFVLSSIARCLTVHYFAFWCEPPLHMPAAATLYNMFRLTLFRYMFMMDIYFQMWEKICFKYLFKSISCNYIGWDRNLNGWSNDKINRFIIWSLKRYYFKWIQMIGKNVRFFKNVHKALFCDRCHIMMIQKIV